MEKPVFEGVQEQKPETNESIEIQKHIQDTQSLTELFSVLSVIDTIQGSKDSYTGAELIEIIKMVADKKAPLEGVTKTFGLRDKVYELLGDNVASTELAERKIFTNAMKAATDIESLCVVLNNAESEFKITDDEHFNAQDAIATINAVEAGTKTIEDVTPAYGLREKVEELVVQRTDVAKESQEAVEKIPEPAPVEAVISDEEKNALEDEASKIVAEIETIEVKLGMTRGEIEKIEESATSVVEPSITSKIKGFWFKKILKQENYQVPGKTTTSLTAEQQAKIEELKKEEKDLQDEHENLSHKHVEILNQLK